MAEESRAAPFRFRKIRAKPMPALACYPEMHYNEKMGFTTKKNGVYRKMTATVIQKLYRRQQGADFRSLLCGYAGEGL